MDDGRATRRTCYDRAMPDADEPAPAAPPARRHPSDLTLVLIVLGALLLIGLVLAGLTWMVMRLHDASALQDCVLAGRRNCGKAYPEF
jgi:uncharacterized membrane protein YhaH (DUF805 family)